MVDRFYSFSRANLMTRAEKIKTAWRNDLENIITESFVEVLGPSATWYNTLQDPKITFQIDSLLAQIGLRRINDTNNDTRSMVRH